MRILPVKMVMFQFASLNDRRVAKAIKMEKI